MTRSKTQENSYSKRHIAKARATGGITQQHPQQGLARDGPDKIGRKLNRQTIFSRL